MAKLDRARNGMSATILHCGTRQVVARYGVQPARKNRKYMITFHRLSIIVSTCVLASAGWMLYIYAQGRDDRLMNELSVKYRNATTDDERRDVCIKAIDYRLIRRGASISTLDRIFGTSFHSSSTNSLPSVIANSLPSHFSFPSESDAKGGIVYFAPQITTPPKHLPYRADSVSVGRVGWYFAFEIDPYSGAIWTYYVSNVHR